MTQFNKGRIFSVSISNHRLFPDISNFIDRLVLSEPVGARRSRLPCAPPGGRRISPSISASGSIALGRDSFRDAREGFLGDAWGRCCARDSVVGPDDVIEALDGDLRPFELLRAIHCFIVALYSSNVLLSYIYYHCCLFFQFDSAYSSKKEKKTKMGKKLIE